MITKALPALTTAVLLTACQPAPSAHDASSSLSASVPAFELIGASAEASSDDSSETQSPIADPEWLVKARAEEEKHMAAYPDVAVRSGDVLTVNFGGKAVASFTDMGKTECEGNETCSIWQFSDVIALQSEPGRKQPYVHIVRDNGEISEHVLISADGGLYWVASGFTASKDGRFLASGVSESVLDEGFFKIVDFASPGHRMQAEFDAQCDVAKWTSARTVSVNCSRHDDGSVAVMADVTEVSPGVWRFQETAILKKPAGEKTELKSQTLSLAAKPWTAAQQAELTAYDQKIGYKRLVP